MCKHRLTKAFSITLDIDHCVNCKGYLVWCHIKEHRDLETPGLDWAAFNEGGFLVRPDGKHYHLIPEEPRGVVEAMHLAKAIRLTAEARAGRGRI